jgi:hypothetical protein
VRLWTLLDTDWVFGDYVYGSGPAGPVGPAKGFYTVTPCRLVDTRGGSVPIGGPALAAGLSPEGGLVVLCQQPTGTVHFILDVNGYFVE